MIEHVVGINTNLNGFRFADSEYLARTHIQRPISEVLEVPEAQIAHLSGLGVFQQHFAWCTVCIAPGERLDVTDICQLQVRPHLVRCSDLIVAIFTKERNQAHD